MKSVVRFTLIFGFDGFFCIFLVLLLSRLHVSTLSCTDAIFYSLSYLSSIFVELSTVHSDYNNKRDDVTNIVKPIQSMSRILFYCYLSLTLHY